MPHLLPLRYFLVLLTLMLQGLTAICQKMQATIKPGSTPTSVDIYTRSTVSFSRYDDQVTITLAIPASVVPVPGESKSPTILNQAGLVPGLNGVRPNILYTGITAENVEVVTSMETINNLPYSVYTIVFGYTTPIFHTYVAGVEQKVLTVQFEGCTSNCSLLATDILMVSLPNGGKNAISYFYYQSNTIADITDVTEMFYQNPQSRKPINGGSYEHLSTIGVAGPIEIGDLKQAEGDSGTTLFNFNVNLRQPAPPGGITFHLNTSEGTATPGVDYTPVNRSFAIPSGSSSIVVPVNISGDRTTEPHETFNVNITQANIDNFAPRTAVGTIISDDGVLPPNLTIDDVQQTEGHNSGIMGFKVALSHPAPAGGVRFSVALKPGIAQVSIDYGPIISSTLYEIPEGGLSTVIPVQILGDRAAEADEDFQMIITSAYNAIIVDSIGTGTILNDDTLLLPALSVANISKAEGNGGTTKFEFKVSLSSPAPTEGVTFRFVTIGGTASPASDFVSLTSVGRIQHDSTSTTVIVNVLGDFAKEADETFNVSITDATNADITVGTATATITNDDVLELREITMPPSPVMQNEGNSGTTTFNIQVDLSAPAPAGGVTFRVRTLDGSARSLNDYVPLDTNWHISAGNISTTIPIKILADLIREDNEYFYMNLLSITNAYLLTATLEVRILNDDSPPGFSNPADHFRSRQPGGFTSYSTWESSPDSFKTIIVSPATTRPDYRANTITIRHDLRLNTDIMLDQTTITPGGSISINNNFTLEVVDGEGPDMIVNGKITINPGGKMIIKSSATGTASVGKSSGSVMGEVTVERYIPDNGHRAWRLLSVPVNGTRSIMETWQESGQALPYYGTLLFSNFYHGATGFDGFSDSSTIFTYKQGGIAGPQWLPLPSTTLPLSSHNAYRVFVHGDKSALPSNNLRKPTTLRSTGDLNMGIQPPIVVPATGPGYTLVGNPYASPVSFENIASTANLNPLYYAWDANLGGTTGVGGYRLVERLSPGVYRQTPQLAGAASDNSNLQFIHSGQAIMLKASGADAVVKFIEDFKSDQLPPFNPFRTVALQPELSINLLSVPAGEAPELVDGVRVNFDNAYSDKVTPEDIIKLHNFSENLAVRAGNTMLIVDKRPEVMIADTVFLQLTNTRIGSYRFEISGKNMLSGYAAYLHDSYLNSQTPLDLTTSTYVDYTVSADVRSSAADRFKVVVKTLNTLPVTLTSFKAFQQADGIAVEWKVQNESSIKHYELEKSYEGRTFKSTITKPATGNNMSKVDYAWFDRDAKQGNNFYRLRSIGVNGQIQLSHVVNVFITNKKAGFLVYPNPITSGIINLQFVNQPTGIYTVRLSNAIGQLISAKSINHTAGSSTESLQLDYNVLTGNYFLEVNGPGKIRQSFKITR
ncbi:T9SS type A sorting domain-containing protein [Segetibacter sp. 3557_3]|uniref:Calx-beta domain-containing protein n=1 Tax=Segetibacter sp. 3557_3 TaxID=2547429 RepID=UPI001058B990|nr:Calx-beta domain-containing protein [Segetibacter sp. 3557_3]TDH28697.1 T9SS type A sorting domain-containing protein [Segetibacter sp. 3557_3]